MSRAIIEQRVRSASMALDTFRHQAGEDDERTLMLDLIADLGHLAASRRLDFLKIVAQAVSAWAYERKHSDGADPSPQVTITIEGRKPKRAWPTEVMGGS